MKPSSSPFKWRRYAPEVNKRMRPHLKLSGSSYRLDETYVKVGTECEISLQGGRLGGRYHRVHAQRQTRRFCGKTILQEVDAGRPSETALHDRDGQACLLPGGLRCF